MQRYDEELRLVFDQPDERWKVVRHAGNNLWFPVRVCQWEDRDSTYRPPGQWLLHSLFDGRIKVKTPEEAAKWVQARRKREKEAKAKKDEKRGQTIEEMAKHHYPSMEKTVVTHPGMPS
ncbi:MAG: hypothetical protein GY937_20175 [bacterium]|nr:hypothetical protein [bacterium]